MTAKELVKQEYPKAYIEHYKTRDVFKAKGYWICWSSTKKNEKKRLSTSLKSASNAWVEAKNNILIIKN